ncbi:hypothetical protein L2D01_05975 [Hyphomonadaceae bacterium ML37]|nr:hypothetical protein L2D01_05975 [Hyphomonadaceae bacterium ML37]
MACNISTDRPDPVIAKANDKGVVQVTVNEAAKAQNEAGTRQEFQALGSDLGAVQTRVINDVIATLWMPKDLSPEDRAARANAALLIFARLAPRDEAEAMLAIQMIAAHNAATECYRRSMIPNQTFEGRDQALKHAAKMSALYDKLLASYDKRRGKRDQTVVVKHVTVKDGGQAILGDVHTHAPSDHPGRKALERGDDKTLDGDAFKDEAEREKPARLRQARQDP